MVIKNRGTSCVGVRKTDTTLIMNITVRQSRQSGVARNNQIISPCRNQKEILMNFYTKYLA